MQKEFVTTMLAVRQLTTPTLSVCVQGKMIVLPQKMKCAVVMGTRMTMTVHCVQKPVPREKTLL